MIRLVVVVVVVLRSVVVALFEPSRLPMDSPTSEALDEAVDSLRSTLILTALFVAFGFAYLPSSEFGLQKRLVGVSPTSSGATYSLPTNQLVRLSVILGSNRVVVVFVALTIWPSQLSSRSLRELECKKARDRSR